MAVVVEQEKVPRSGRWAGYAASACAFLFAAVSFYWGLGGMAGLDSVGQEAVQLSKSGNIAVFAALLFVGLLKVAGGLLSLALVQPWGHLRFRRWMLLLAGWGGSALLVLYGSALTGVQLLVRAGIIQAPADMDWRGFYGHLYLWNPWFVLWGVLLGITTFSYTRWSRRQIRQARVASPDPAGVTVILSTEGARPTFRHGPVSAGPGAPPEPSARSKSRAPSAS